MDNYNFFIINGYEYFEINPLNIDDISFISESHNYTLYKTYKCSDLTISKKNNPEAYLFLEEYFLNNICEIPKIEIRKKGELILELVFDKTDISINYSKCLITLKTRSNSIYNKVDLKLKDKINALSFTNVRFGDINQSTFGLFNKGARLMDVLNYFALQSGSTGLVSDFFEYNPIGDSLGYSTGINYKTGMPNEYNNLIVTSSFYLSRFLDNSITFSDSLQLEFSFVMDFLYNHFKCFYFIDENNKFRVEHVSYFFNKAQLTLTDLKTEFYDKDISIKDLEYDGVEYEYQFSFPNREDFNITSYANTCITNNVFNRNKGLIDNNKKISLDKVTLDVENIIYNDVLDVSDSDIVILATNLLPAVSPPTYQIINGNIPILNINAFNSPMAFSNLFQRFIKEYEYFYQLSYYNNNNVSHDFYQFIFEVKEEINIKSEFENLQIPILNSEIGLIRLENPIYYPSKCIFKTKILYNDTEYFKN